MSARSDEGFTLVEVLAALAITGIIGSVLFSVILIGYRTTDDTATRLAESTDAQLVSTYLVADLQSVGSGGVNTDPVAVGCGSAGTNVLQLSWADAAGGGSFVASYRLETAGSVRKLTRNLCKTAPAPPTMQTITVAHDLSGSIAPVVTPNPVVPATVRVSLRLTEASGFAYTVAGDRRTPNAVAPTTTPTTAPTTSTPTTIPPTCDVTGAAQVSPNPVQRQNSGHLKDDVIITLHVSPTCEPLHLHLTPANEPQPIHTSVLTDNGATQTITIKKNAYNWTVGTKTITVVRDNESDVPSSSFTLQVTS